jgi:hypothetical protein
VRSLQARALGGLVRARRPLRVLAMSGWVIAIDLLFVALLLWVVFGD